MPRILNAPLPAKRLLLILVPVFLAAGSGAAFAANGPGAAVTPPPPAPKAFPDFGFLPVPDKTTPYTGPLFQLSQNYPKQMPRTSSVPAFFKKLPAKPLSPDFKTWREYMMGVRDYCFEGNIDPKGTLDEKVDWRVEKNTVRNWYHIPWQHYGATGREGIHGLTKEAPVQPRQLAISQTYDVGQTYAVGIFNDLAGYAIGRVWADPMNPNPAVMSSPSKGFPNGTVMCKLLFVDVPVQQVPSLVNPVQWTAYITDKFASTNRSNRMVSLIQMDIAIKDVRTPTGWLFGTFQYNGRLNKANRWENLIPVGIMWGNDPAIKDDAYTNQFPDVTKINPNLKETSINPDTNELPPTHLGWNGRLNGPVDNYQSSCLSCHMTAEVQQVSPIAPMFQKNAPKPGSPEWMRWFQNTKGGQPFDKGQLSADFSLQLSMGIANFLKWRDSEDGYTSQGTVFERRAAAGVKGKAKVRADKVHPPLRDHPDFR